MNYQELSQLQGCLAQVLTSDNATRKAAEQQLNDLKRADADKYASYMVHLMNAPKDQIDVPSDQKSLAAVILRRNVSTSSVDTSDVKDVANNANLWMRLSDQARIYVKSQILENLNAANPVDKNLTHKICSLAVEVQGAMYEHEDSVIWQDLLNVLFQMINSEHQDKVDAALQIFNGLFSYIMDHLVQYKDDLRVIFEKTLQHSCLDIKLAALQATVNLLSIAERKETKAFLPLLPLMVAVISAAMEADDETVLADALVEFNELAECEPMFFKPHMKDIYTRIKPIVMHQDFANQNIRHQPLEFIVSLIERIPSVVKKDIELLKDILELVFRLMIDIDDDIEAEWLSPKEGFTADGDEEEDNVNFGKGCVDRLVSTIGDEIMLPLIGTLVTNTIQNDTDWRYKHAGIMAFSQIGEYVDSPEKLAMMIPVVVQHCTHPNPKIRYASLHCIGQVADDMAETFQEAYHAEILPVLINCLDDQVPRVASHACAALTNFMEGANKEIVLPHLQVLAQKLVLLIRNGISLVKENAATALASTVEQAKEAFVPYFQETLQLLIGVLSEFHQKEYKQFRGQVIEAITIICAAVGEESFMSVAHDLIGVLVNIQNTQLEQKDAQRVYLLSAWQRICLQMKEKFAPYLKDVLPSVFSMANLNPEMGISGQDALADLADVITELRPNDENGAEKKLSVVTDETEEKDVAIQMLSVFIDELGGAFAEYVEPASRIMLSLTKYQANESIRTTCADALPGLIKCAKAKIGQSPQLIEMAKQYQANLIEAMKDETDCECLISQVNALKSIIDETGKGFLSQAEIDFLSTKSVGIIEKSLDRIDGLEKMKLEEAEDEDEQFDDNDLDLIKEEGQNEYDLQLAAAELMGCLFKTHPDMVSELVKKLRTETLAAAFASGIQKRLKFGLFVLDDMVEHLGPNYFSPEDYNTIVQTVCSFAQNKSASLRQASAYGIGVIAQYGGHGFITHADFCLASLRSAVDYQMSAKVQEKKSKQDQFHHARDNAIASIGKVIKFQREYIQSRPELGPITKYWIDNLPITHDVQEGQLQYEYLSEFLLQQPEYILSADPAGAAAQIAKIYGEAFSEHYFTESNKMLMANAVRYMMNSPDPIKSSFTATCQNVLSEAAKLHVQAAFNFQA